MRQIGRKLARITILLALVIALAAGSLSLGAVKVFAEDEVPVVNAETMDDAGQEGEEPEEPEEPAGTLEEGWQQIDGVWYYGNSDGTAKTG